MRRTAILAICSVVAVAATTFVTARPGGQEAAAAELERYGGCDALHDRIVAEAMDQVGPYGLDQGGPVMYMEQPAVGMARDSVAMEGTASAGAASAAAPAPDAASSTVSATGTNVQVAGVDEPDQVKLADGLLAVVDGARIVLVDVTAETPRPVATIDPPASLKLSPTGLLVAGQRLIVLGSTGGGPVPGPAESAPAGAPMRGGDVAGIMPAGPARTAVAVYDIATPASPTLVDHLTIDGRLLSARLTGGRLLLATSNTPSLPFVYPGGGGQDSVDRATSLNRQVVAESTVEQWLGQVTLADGTTRLLADCTQVGVPTQIDGWQAISLAAVDPSGPLGDIRAAGTFGAGQTVYATADRVYVAGTRVVPDRIATLVHAFGTDGAPSYVGSGEVEGELLNQFAMDRFEGHLRVATTPMTIQGPGGAEITVLDERGGSLVAVGHLTGLGAGETIRAVRYLGPVGFVVTFRQTDPLFTLDLSDPTAPQAMGELKIPGYSAYLHPIADGLLLGVGRSATESGQVTGLQVSLFDTHDLSAPVRRGVLQLDGGATAVEWDHHAFTWMDEADVAAIPVEAGWMAVPMPEPMMEAPPPGDASGTGGATGAGEAGSGSTGAGVSSSAGGSSSAATATSGGTVEPEAPAAPLPPPDEPTPDRPGMPPQQRFAGLLLVRVTGNTLTEVARVEGPAADGWSTGFSRTVVDGTTFLAVAPGAVWRISAEGAVLAKARLA